MPNTQLGELLARISHTCISRFDFTEIGTILGSLWVIRLPIAAVGAAMAVLTGLHTARGVFEAHLDLPRPVKIFWLPWNAWLAENGPGPSQNGTDPEEVFVNLGKNPLVGISDSEGHHDAPDADLHLSSDL